MWSNSWTVRKQNWRQTALLRRICLPNATARVINIYSYSVSSITENMTLQSKRRICKSDTGQICNRRKPQEDGTCAPNIRMEIPPGNAWQTLKNCIPSRLQIMPLLTVWIRSLHLPPGGYRLPSNVRTGSSLLSTNATISGHINLVSKYRKCTTIASELINKMIIRFGKIS